MDDREMRSNASFDFTGMGDAVEYMPGFNRWGAVVCHWLCLVPWYSTCSHSLSLSLSFIHQI